MDISPRISYIRSKNEAQRVYCTQTANIGNEALIQFQFPKAQTSRIPPHQVSAQPLYVVTSDITVQQLKFDLWAVVDLGHIGLQIPLEQSPLVCAEGGALLDLPQGIWRHGGHIRMIMYYSSSCRNSPGFNNVQLIPMHCSLASHTAIHTPSQSLITGQTIPCGCGASGVLRAILSSSLSNHLLSSIFKVIA